MSQQDNPAEEDIHLASGYSVLEVDDTDDGHDTDSALGDEMSLLSSTASIRSSLMGTSEENGRKYHKYKEGRYVLPVDDTELERWTYQYNLCLATFGAYSFAPFTKLDRVLDVGCGRGFWAMDFAQVHPEAEVIGVDLSPVQPQFTPVNVQFEIDDLEEAWTFSFDFDYIHVLMMTGAFKDWPNFYRQAFEFLNKDGWVEVQDIDFPLCCDDGSLPDDSPLRRWSNMLMEAGELSGFRLNTCGEAADMMRAAGFVDVVRIPFKWPMGPWPRLPEHKRLGFWVAENFDMGAEAMLLALFTRFLNWTREQVVDFANEVRAGFRNHAYHTYFNLWVTYGRKP